MMSPRASCCPYGEQAAEVDEFTVSVIEESEHSDRVVAVVSSESFSSSVPSYGGKKKAVGESPRRACWWDWRW